MLESHEGRPDFRRKTLSSNPKILKGDTLDVRAPPPTGRLSAAISVSRVL